MSIKIKCKWLLIVFLSVVVLSCKREKSHEEQETPMEMPADSVPADTLTEEEEELGLIEEAENVDNVFSDFLFAYLHSPTLRRERTARPLRLELAGGQAEALNDFDPTFEFGFLSGEYFTSLYGGKAQMLAEDEDEQESDSTVCVQRINLNDGTIRNFNFLREDGRWRLEAIREATFEDDELHDFLQFYARFCSDSLFQAESVADPLHISIQDSDDEEGIIDGIIDADQWQTFCPEVPAGIISNIRKGQQYGRHRIVLRKSGLSNGLQEVFTFTRERGNWHLTRYEN